MQIAVLVFVAALILIYSNLPVQGQSDESKPPEQILSANKEPSPIKAEPLSRSEISKRLKLLDSLVEEEAKKPRPPIAMCYAPRMYESELVDYFCPRCGSKTNFVKENLRELESCREKVKSLTRISAVLDERFFCGACNKDKKFPGLFIEVTYPESGKTGRTQVNSQELGALVDFLKGPTVANDGLPGMRVTDFSKKIHEILEAPKD